MKWTICTDVGVARKENQDKAKVFIKGKHIFALLCDGMGGHVGGQQAANITINVFEKEFQRRLPKNKEELAPWFKNTLKKVKLQMQKEAKKKPELLDMGTTLTATYIYENEVIVFNIGDSRTYIYNGKLHQITVDHNLRNYYINEQKISVEKAGHIMGGAALTSALGPTKKTKVDAFEIAIDKNTKYIILTSDGIHDYISKPNFELLIQNTENIDGLAKELIKSGVAGESLDNLTVIIVELDE